MNGRVILLATLTLIAFASNSILTRLALRDYGIDVGSFTFIRILSGALILWLLIALPKKKNPVEVGGSWKSALALAAYAVAFSLAYLDLAAGTGALILFGSVQVTMIITGMVKGERPSVLEWIGLVLAFGGLVYLVLPGVSAPDPVGAALMAIAGIAWGFYSWLGKGVPDPSAATAGNFSRATPMALAVSYTHLRAHET